MTLDRRPDLINEINEAVERYGHLPEPARTDRFRSAVLADPEPLGTCIVHGDYWTDYCTRCGW